MDNFFEYTLSAKVEREYDAMMSGGIEPSFVWGRDGAIPAFLLKDCDRDEDEPDQYGRNDGD